jgi:hypothetical protein
MSSTPASPESWSADMPGPEVFRLPHLSEDAVAAFADGVLSASATERARKHCAECAECAAAVRGQREAVMMLRAAPTPSLPSGLLARLTGLPNAVPLQSPHTGLRTGLGPDGTPVIITGPVAEQPAPAAEPSTEPEPGEQALIAVAPTHASWLHPSPRSRRVALPLGVVATAAVVLAGTIGQSGNSAPPATQLTARQAVLLTGAPARTAPAAQATVSPSIITAVELGTSGRP